MKDNEFEKRKKNVEDLKKKLQELKEKVETEENKKDQVFASDETIMMPKKAKDEIKKIYEKANEKLKEDKEKDILKEKEDLKRKREERLKEKRKKQLELIKREKEDKKIKEQMVEEDLKKGKKVPFKKLSGKQKAKVITKNIFLTIIFLIIIAIGLLIGYVYGLFGNDMGIDKNLLDGPAQTTVIHDRDGKEIARLSDDERRTVIKLNEMGKYIPEAYISIEDQRFHDHPGIDVKRTFGAVFNYTIKRKSSYGGSTITQQLVKNITNDNDRSAARKVREFSRALQLEQRMSKDEILELYLNLIFVGGENVYGIALASDYYFCKKPADLKLEEAAFLAGINHSPGMYNPYMEKGFHLDKNDEKVIDNKKQYNEYVKMQEKIKDRTNTVLGKMHELNKISDEEYNKALANTKKGLNFKKGNLVKSTYEYSNIADAAIDEAIDAISEKRKIEKKVAKIVLLRGGYHIYTTQDSKMQKQVENAMRSKQHTLYSVEHKDEKGKPYKTQATTTIIDHKTGQIVAAVGGLEDEVRMKRGDWNRVTRTLRQPGSAIKPIVVTAPGLESGKFTLGHTFNDTPYEKNGWKPQNFSRTFSGRTTVRKALVKSLNIPQIRQLEKISPKYAADFLRKMNFDVAEEDNNNLAIAIGGFTRGFTNINMTSAYAMIANDGEFIEPTFIVRIENSRGDTVYKPEPKRERVMSQGNAFLLKDVLKGSTNRGEICAQGYIPNIDVAAKTGTTDNFFDSYYCTFSNYYTAATWYGFDKAESFNNSGRYFNPAMDILSNIFKQIHAGKPGSRFKKPDNIIKETVWFNDFKKAPAGVRGTLTELFVKGTEPKENGAGDYVTVRICKKSGKLATDDCDPKDVEVRSFKKGTEPTEYCNECKSHNKSKNDQADREVNDIIATFNRLGNINNYTSENRSQLLLAKNLYESASSEAKAKLSQGIKNKYNQIVAKLSQFNNETEQNAANNVINKINKIPGNITEENKGVVSAAINSARASYNSLTPSAKKLVTNYSRLLDAEKKLKGLN